MCGKTDEANDAEFGGDLSDFTVEVRRGEEGHSLVTRFACYEHEGELSEALMKLGFESHRHGGTTFLADDEDPACGGYGKCDLFDEEGPLEEVY